MIDKQKARSLLLRTSLLLIFWGFILFLLYQALHNAAVAAFPILQNGIDAGNRGAADGNLLLDHAIGRTVEK